MEDREQVPRDTTHQHHELVQSPVVDAQPLLADRLQEAAVELNGNRWIVKAVKQRAHVLAELLLDQWFVAHPHAVVESLPQAQKVLVGEGWEMRGIIELMEGVERWDYSLLLLTKGRLGPGVEPLLEVLQELVANLFVVARQRQREFYVLRDEVHLRLHVVLGQRLGRFIFRLNNSRFGLIIPLLELFKLCRTWSVHYGYHCCVSEGEGGLLYSDIAECCC